MNELEILAKLKRIYNELLDIYDNSSFRISSKTFEDLSDKYDDVYSEIKLNSPDKLKIEVEGKTYYICDNVYCDYEDELGDDYTAEDIDYYWWFDEEFIK